MDKAGLRGGEGDEASAGEASAGEASGEVGPPEGRSGPRTRGEGIPPVSINRDTQLADLIVPVGRGG